MTNKERDKITDILNENGYYGIDIQEYCFEVLRQDQEGLIPKLIDVLEEAIL